MSDESQVWPFQKPMRDRVRVVLLNLSKKQTQKLLADALKALDLIEERMRYELEEIAAEKEAMQEKEGSVLQ